MVRQARWLWGLVSKFWIFFYDCFVEQVENWKWI